MLKTPQQLHDEELARKDDQLVITTWKELMAKPSHTKDETEMLWIIQWWFGGRKELMNAVRKMTANSVSHAQF